MTYYLGDDEFEDCNCLGTFYGPSVMESFTKAGQDTMDESICFSNFSLSSDNYYFLYIGELKAHGLTDYLTKALAPRCNRPVSCLSIVPDILGEYNYENIIALSPLLARNRKQHGRRISFRTPMQDFAESVSHHPAILEIIEQILTQQAELYLFMFESLPEMTLDRLANVSLLGPEKTLARKLNNKAFQFELLQNRIPMVEFPEMMPIPEPKKLIAILMRYKMAIPPVAATTPSLKFSVAWIRPDL